MQAHKFGLSFVNCEECILRKRGKSLVKLYKSCVPIHTMAGEYQLLWETENTHETYMKKWYHRISGNTWHCYTKTITVKTVLSTNSPQVRVSSRYTSEIKNLWNIFISGYITHNRLSFSLKQGTKPDEKSSKVFWCTGSLQETSAKHTSLSFKMNRCKFSS